MMVVLLCFYGVLFAVQLQLMEKKSLISDNNHFLQLGGSLCISPDGNYYIIPDFKAGDIKIFSRESGRLLKIEGRKGVGPNELLMPFKCTANERYIALLDLGLRRYFIYEFVKPIGLKRIDDGMPVDAGFDCAMNKGMLALSSFIYGAHGKSYHAYGVNIKDKSITYLLPSEIKYGYSSVDEYESAYQGNDIVCIGIQGYCDIYNDLLYYVWEGDLRIIRVDTSTRGIITFGKKTENYTKPKVSSRLARAYANGDNVVRSEERKKLTLVDDINVSRNYIILSYMKPDPYLGRRVRMLQFYGHDQKLIAEIMAPREISFNDENEAISMTIEKGKDRLICMRRFLNKDETDDLYEILVYDIVK